MFFVCLSLNLVYLVSIVIIPCEGEERFTIIRSSVVDSPKADEFIVPRSKCSPSSLSCSTLYAGSTNHDPTQCECVCRHEFSSFGYYNERWICKSNRQVRKQQGCQFQFDGEHNFQPLRVLSTGHRYRIIFPSVDCTIDQSASRYRKCDGTWAAISVQSNIFTFLAITENLGSGRYRYTMKVGSATSLAGRMVNLKVNCRNPSKSSCVFFKMAGQISCPVDIVRFTSTQSPSFTVTYPKTTPPVVSDVPTGNSSTEAPGPGKRASDSGDTGGSSGTVAAVVIIIILVIIVAAIIGFIIWKRKRGENILLMDYLISIARKFKSPPPTKKPDEPEEQIYAEIPEQPAQMQRATTYSAPAYAEISNYVFNHPNTDYTRPNYNQQNKMPSPTIPYEAPTDERGYMVPVDSPFHNSVQNNDPQNPHSNDKNTIPKTCSIREDRQTSTQGGGVGGNDVVPYYDVLDIPDAQNTENHAKQIPVYNRQPDRNVEVGSSFVSPSEVPGTKGAADNNRYVAKQRRRPPSPPRKV